MIHLTDKITISSIGEVEYHGVRKGHIRSLPMDRNAISDEILAAWRKWLGVQ